MSAPERVSILLVDDEPRNLDVLESVLEDPCYRLLRASDADTALRLLLDNEVAAIVLDIKMPGVSGFELAQMIKGAKRFRQIPIVFMTAYLVDDKDVISGYGAGAVDYLTKPVNPAILRHKIAVFADLFRKTRALAELNEHLEQRVAQRTAELARSEAALRESNAQKDRFIATLAHELRNPLAPLRAGVELLRLLPSRPPEADRTLTVMKRQLDHMVRLIDDLLDVARIARGTLELRKQPVDLFSAVELAVETAGPALARKEQRITTSGHGPIPVVADPTRIAQIVANLLSNASIHSPPGACIEVRVRAEGSTVVIDVADPGTGIAPDRLDRIFDTFADPGELAERGKRGGLGIGLSLSRSLAELHGGSLTAKSPGLGAGATFTLVIPAGASDDTTPRDEKRALSAAGGGERGAPLRVVVIEDNEDAAEMLYHWLRARGADVEVAHTGTQGLALVRRLRPDVVLCDIGLPEMDGIDVCRSTLQEIVPPPLMVAVTGWGTPSDRTRTREAGFRHHFVKPVALDELGALLDSVAEHRAAAAPHE